MMVETKNAKITGTMLGIEDHGILTAMLYLDYGGTAQGFGGYQLDRYVEGQRRRVGTAAGSQFTSACSTRWAWTGGRNLIGCHVRVRADRTKVHAIGHIIEDRWFDPQTIYGEAGDGVA